MALINTPPLPLGDPIAKARRPEYRNRPDPQEGQVTKVWADYFAHQVDLGEKFPGRVANVELMGQTDAKGSTDMTGGTLTTGLYRVSYYMPVVTAGGLGDTIQLTIDWQDGGVTRTRTGASVDGTSTASYDSDVFLIRSDAGAPVRYSTVFGAGPVGYDLHITLEEVLA